MSSNNNHPDELRRLQYKRPSHKDITAMEKMVQWFSPSVLFKVIKPVILSGIFGEYADRRLIHAALDFTEADEQLRHTDIRSTFATDDDGGIWLDYVADTGDGFDATYAIAHSLAQPTLTVGEENTTRGDVLILGGDQVYPDATYGNYIRRFKIPFGWALPNKGDDKDVKHPKMYAVPGNHDWYDGLTLFLAMFCKHNVDWKVGNWRTPQRRNYFALQLSDKWWLWGIDIGLSADIDQPQSDYFANIASKMPKGSKLIICTAAPGWQYSRIDREQIWNDHTYSGLSYISGLARKADRDIEIPLVLSGDSHHYCRYVAKEQGTQFVTAGGGGAFLHPTSHLKQSIKAWWFRDNDEIELASLQDSTAGKGSQPKPGQHQSQPACYPSQDESRNLLTGNLAFAFKNRKFAGLLGFAYALLGLLLLMWNDLSIWDGLLSNPLLVPVFLLLVWIYIHYADGANWVQNGKVKWQQSSTKGRKRLLGGVHATLHLGAIVFLSRYLYELGTEQFELPFWTTWFNVYFLAAMTVLAGLFGGTIFGLNLYLTYRFLGIHFNEAFSALSSPKYKNFVRIRIKDDKLSLYPIGLDQVPCRTGWKVHTKETQKDSTSWVVPKTPLKHRLIEGPIRVK